MITVEFLLNITKFNTNHLGRQANMHLTIVAKFYENLIKTI